MSNKIRRLVRKSNSREDGFTLIEVLVGLAIMSIIAVGIYSALSAGLASTVDEDERATAKNLAEAQLEYVKHLMFTYAEWKDYGEKPPDVYDPDDGILSQYSGYEVTIDGSMADEENRDKFLQLITVTVFHDGEEVLILEGYKVISEDTFPSL